MNRWLVWGMIWGCCLLARLAHAEPLKVIFDTDMDGDNDDVAAAAILHALADEGRVKILAMGVVSRCPQSPACLDAINTYYGRGEISIGVYKGKTLAEVSSPYAKVVAERCANDVGLAEKVPDVLKVYRRALAGEADGAVTMIAVGQMNNLVGLLASEADEISPLAGKELVKRKVAALFVMGPYFNERGEFQRAYNFTTSPKAAMELVNSWPTRIKFGEGNLGHRHFIGGRLKETPAENPARIAFEAYFAREKQNAGKSENRRHCADPTTVLYAVCGGEYFGEMGPGACEVREDGYTRWNAERDKQQFYNTQKVGVKELEEVMEKLLVRAPRPKYLIQTLAGNGMAGDVPSGGGKASEICVDMPFGVESGPDGGLYITTVGSHRVLRLDRANGEIRSVVGNGLKGNSGDGGPAGEAELDEPYEVRFDSRGNMFVLDMKSNVVRRIDAKNGKIETVLGDGVAGDRGDGGPARQARLRSPHSIALDEKDNLYVSDLGNHRVKRIDAKSGQIETIVGNGKSGLPREGGMAREEPFMTPQGLVVRGENLWIASVSGQSVWRLDLKDGTIHRVAGMGKRGHGGDGGDALLATLDGPRGMTMSSAGFLYLVEGENNVIRTIDTVGGVIWTVAGVGAEQFRFGGDGMAATLAPLWQPHGVLVDQKGSLTISDTKNHRVRVLTPIGGTGR